MSRVVTIREFSIWNGSWLKMDGSTPWELTTPLYEASANLRPDTWPSEIRNALHSTAADFLARNPTREAIAISYGITIERDQRNGKDIRFCSMILHLRELASPADDAEGDAEGDVAATADDPTERPTHSVCPPELATPPACRREGCGD